MAFFARPVVVLLIRLLLALLTRLRSGLFYPTLTADPQDLLNLGNRITSLLAHFLPPSALAVGHRGVNGTKRERL